MTPNIAELPFVERIEESTPEQEKILQSFAAYFKCKVRKSSNDEDEILGIDGWFCLKLMRDEESLQVKRRVQGDDVIFDAVECISTKKEGRDMNTKAHFYVVADTRGVVRLFFTEDFKRDAKPIVNQMWKDLETNPYKRHWNGEDYSAKIFLDPYTNHEKFCIFFFPSRYDILATWKL